MDTKELLAARDKLEIDMREALVNLVEKFETDSGIGVSGIRVDFVDTTTFMCRSRSAVIARVEVKLEVE